MRTWRAAIALTIASLGACVPILGIRDLEVDAQDSGQRPPAEAAVVDTPPSEDAEGDAGPAFKRVFVTSDVSNGILGGVVGADGRCAAAAERGQLGGRWVAWLSDETMNAATRVSFPGPYRLLDGREVVTDKNQLLSGTLSASIDVDEFGRTATGFTGVWTGTYANGKSSDHCSGWTSNAAFVFGASGSFDQKNEAWTKNGGPGGGFENWGCQTSCRLYCFEL